MFTMLMEFFGGFGGRTGSPPGEEVVRPLLLCEFADIFLLSGKVPPFSIKGEGEGGVLPGPGEC